MSSFSNPLAYLQALAKRPSFDEWYADYSNRFGQSPDPNDPRHQYDYKAAYAAGLNPDEEGHLSSLYKKPGHPTLVRYFDGQLMNTRTGLPAEYYELLGNQSFGRHQSAQLDIEEALNKRIKPSWL